jgi:2-keto-3-deoxy-L-rhamnonate aldolase RhmA
MKRANELKNHNIPINSLIWYNSIIRIQLNKSGGNMSHPLIEKMRQGLSVYGPWVITNSVDNVIMFGRAGVDCLIIDCEHGNMSMETAGTMVSVIRQFSTSPLIRVPGNDPIWIKKGLDTGVDGVMIPMINSKQEAESAVSYCKYPPEGIRGLGAGRATYSFVDGDAYFKSANKNIMIIVQIEHYKAVDQIDEILSVPGIDVAFIGPYDLSVSLGIPGQIQNSEVELAISKVLKSCEAHSVIPGIFAGKAFLKKYREMGFKLLLGGLDGHMLYEAALDYKKAFED